MTDLDPIVILEDPDFQALVRAGAPAWSHKVLAGLAVFILARAKASQELRAPAAASTELRELFDVREQLGKPDAGDMSDETDDAAVDRFAAAMKAKLAEKRADGYGGWDDPERCPPGRLAELLTDHVAKGDPVDVGNFAMMLFCSGESTIVRPPVADAWTVELGNAAAERLDMDRLTYWQGRAIVAEGHQGWLRGKVMEQRKRIVYLEGATQHAGGTPLSKAIAERDAAKARVAELEREVETKRQKARMYDDAAALLDALGVAKSGMHGSFTVQHRIGILNDENQAELAKADASNPKADPAAVVGGSASSALMGHHDQPEQKP